MKTFGLIAIVGMVLTFSTYSYNRVEKSALNAERARNKTLEVELEKSQQRVADLEKMFAIEKKDSEETAEPKDEKKEAAAKASS